MATRPDTTESDEVERTAPPETDTATGIAMHNGFPLNARLRAEALSKAGKSSDEDGIASDELIKDAGERLARDRAGGPARLSASMRVAELEDAARKAGVDISGASNNPERVRLIEAARAADPAVSQPTLEG